jgi:hypothetical protein
MSSTAFMNNLLSSTHELIKQPDSSTGGINMSNMPVEEESISFELSGGKKGKLLKQKLIDTFKKTDLVKIAKKNDVSLKTRDGSVKTKEQLFNSLKRKKLI